MGSTKWILRSLISSHLMNKHSRDAATAEDFHACMRHKAYSTLNKLILGLGGLSNVAWRRTGPALCGDTWLQASLVGRIAGGEGGCGNVE